MNRPGLFVGVTPFDNASFLATVGRTTGDRSMRIRVFRDARRTA